MKKTGLYGKNVLWNTIGSLFYNICQWLMTVIVVHLSSYGAAGVLSIAMTTSSSFLAIALFGMRNFQISDINEEFSDNEYIGSRVLTCATAFVCCLFSSFLIGNSKETITCILGFMVIRLCEAMIDVFQGIEQKFLRYDFIGTSLIIRGTIIVTLFMIILYFTKNLNLTIWCLAIIYVFVVYYYDWRKINQLENIRPAINNKRILVLLKRCFPIVIFTFLLSTENLLAKKVLLSYYGEEALGLYSSLSSPTLVVQVFATVAFTPLLPILMNNYTSKNINRFAKQYLYVVLGLGLLSITVTLGACIFGKLGLSIIFGKEILSFYDYFMPIVWVTIMMAWVWVLYSIMVGMRMTKELLIGMIVDFIICVVISKPSILYFGVNGASVLQIICLAILAIYIILSSGYRIISIKLWKEKI